MNGRRLVDALRRRGYSFFTGVPCSLLKQAHAILDDDPAYVAAVREDVAVGMAAGAALGGRKAAVFMQNSGLGVCLNALASLTILYEIPTLLVVSWRGQGPDAPEHILTGKITPNILDLLGVPHQVLDAGRIEEQVTEADERGLAALVVPKGVLS